MLLPSGRTPATAQKRDREEGVAIGASSDAVYWRAITLRPSPFDLRNDLAIRDASDAHMDGLEVHSPFGGG